MNIPHALIVLGALFHQDALDDNRTVNLVLCEYTILFGTEPLKVSQDYLRSVVETDDLDTMIAVWDATSADLVFDEYTPEVFKEMIEFEPGSCASNPPLRGFFRESLPDTSSNSTIRTGTDHDR